MLLVLRFLFVCLFFLLSTRVILPFQNFVTTNSVGQVMILYHTDTNVMYVYLFVHIQLKSLTNSVCRLEHIAYGDYSTFEFALIHYLNIIFI